MMKNYSYRKVRELYIMMKKIYLKRFHIEFQKGNRIDTISTFDGYNIISGKVTDSRVGKNSAIYGDILSCVVGKNSYIAPGSNLEHTTIGNFVAIGQDVKTVRGTHPTSTWVSISPFFYSKNPPIKLKPNTDNYYNEYKWVGDNVAIAIGNDVWIGNDVKLMEGIRIGDGAVIATGAVVTRNVPDYAVVGGIPAKVIKYRFGKNDVAYLQKLKWWNREDTWIEKYAKYFSDITILREKIEEE